MKLKLVVLHSPYRNWLIPQMPEYFSKMVELKHKGYQKNYPSHYLPVEATDLIGTHHLVFFQDGQNEVLLSGFKTVFAEQCDFHRLNFPVISMMTRKDQGTPEHRDSVMKIIDDAKIHQQRVSYSSAWTINPEFKDVPELAQAAKDLCVAMLYWHGLEYSINSEFLLGVVKAKTDLFFMNYGYKPISNGSAELPSFSVVDVDDKEVRLLHREAFNKNADVLINKYGRLYQERRVLGDLFGVTEVVEEKLRVA